MKVSSCRGQKAGGDAEHEATDEKEWTIIGDEVIKGLHKVPFLVREWLRLARRLKLWRQRSFREEARAIPRAS
jgi:hypothetical protein